MNHEIKITKKDWTPAKIRSALFSVQGGLGAQAAIARELKITCAAIANTIDGHPSDRIRRAIAVYIGVALEEIWPSIYIDGNVRRPGRRRAKYQPAA